MTTLERYTLKTARERAGYDQKQAAKLLGCSLWTLSNYERGETYPDVPMIQKMEDLYGVEYKQLIFLGTELRLNRNGE